MKYKGKAVSGTNREIIPIPRDGGDIVFIAEAVQSWDQFEALVEEPKPPTMIKAGGARVTNTSDPAYKKAMEDYNEYRTNYLILTSLQATDDLEWETIDLSKPETWGNYKKELLDADFSEIEIGRVLTGVMRANSLDESMIEEARSNFLLGQQGSDQPDSPQEEPTST